MVTMVVTGCCDCDGDDGGDGCSVVSVMTKSIMTVTIMTVVMVIVNLHCQPDWTESPRRHILGWNHLGDTPLRVPMSMFAEEIAD